MVFGGSVQFTSHGGVTESLMYSCIDAQLLSE
jgi:hypothetical protein